MRVSMEIGQDLVDARWAHFSHEVSQIPLLKRYPIRWKNVTRMMVVILWHVRSAPDATMVHLHQQDTRWQWRSSTAEVRCVMIHVVNDRLPAGFRATMIASCHHAGTIRT